MIYLHADHPFQLTAREWIERAQTTLRELDASSDGNTDVGDALDDLNNALEVMEASAPHMVIYGNAIDGHTFIGPFPQHDDALVYAEDSEGPWVIAELEDPNNR